MRIFLALICSLALACVAGAQEPKEKEKQKGKEGKGKPAQAAQVSHPTEKPTGKPPGAGKPTSTGKAAEPGKPAKAGKQTEVGKSTETGKPAEVGKGKAKGKTAEAGQPAEVGKAKTKGKPVEAGKPAEAGKAKTKGKPVEAGKPAEAGTTAAGAKPTATTGSKTAAAGGAATKPAKPFKPQKFDNLPKQPNTTKAPPVKFQQGKHIEGSQNWQGERYSVFRNYHSEWHDEGWWHNHYGNNIVFMFGAPYFLNAGYWFPAWGYTPNAYYAYDGPIYASNNLPPDQVIANVQSALQEQGYYQGEIDGLIGPETRGALAAYQRDHSLYETAAIDQPTLESLGIA